VLDIGFKLGLWVPLICPDTASFLFQVFPSFLWADAQELLFGLFFVDKSLFSMLEENKEETLLLDI
jgi:hypothetical protein